MALTIPPPPFFSSQKRDKEVEECCAQNALCHVGLPISLEELATAIAAPLGQRFACCDSAPPVLWRFKIEEYSLPSLKEQMVLQDKTLLNEKKMHLLSTDDQSREESKDILQMSLLDSLVTLSFNSRVKVFHILYILTGSQLPFDQGSGPASYRVDLWSSWNSCQVLQHPPGSTGSKLRMKTSPERFSCLSQGTSRKLASDSRTDAVPPYNAAPTLHERGCRSFFLRLFLFWLNWVFLAAHGLFSSCDVTRENSISPTDLQNTKNACPKSGQEETDKMHYGECPVLSHFEENQLSSPVKLGWTDDTGGLDIGAGQRATDLVSIGV
ncbi:hypothetical protein MJT46_004903 [Ovis ammon polii x Ovis aries]|nr:hypothetical protein MJT46_004903 [Ovis ammon polii x Ovis aries]